MLPFLCILGLSSFVVFRSGDVKDNVVENQVYGVKRYLKSIEQFRHRSIVEDGIT